MGLSKVKRGCQIAKEKKSADKRKGCQTAKTKLKKIKACAHHSELNRDVHCLRMCHRRRGSPLLAAFCVQGVAARCGVPRLGAGVAAGCKGCAFSWSLEEVCILIQPCVGGEGYVFD